MIKLTIDQGNSRTKLAVFENDTIIQKEMDASYSLVKTLINQSNLSILSTVKSKSKYYDLLREDDRLTIRGTDELGPNSKVTVEAKHSDGTMDTFICSHSMDELQVEWFKAGSALNHLRSKN